MKKYFLLPVIIILFVGVVGGVVQADRGSIPFIPEVRIYEPMQRAVVAWNGEEQILVLSTDLHSSAPVKVLEVLPLPSEPSVKEGDMKIFERIQRVVYQKMWQDLKRPGYRNNDRTGTKIHQAGEVTFHEQIGAHDISVTNVVRADDFVNWANQYLSSLGVDIPTIPEKLKKVIEEYLADGYDWFVFDVVELAETPRTNQAIQYRFKTDELFFPLKITRTEEGETEVELLAIMPTLKPQFKGVTMRGINPPVLINEQDLKGIDEEMAELFTEHKQMTIHSWFLQGRLDSFNEDIRVAMYKPERVYNYLGQFYENCESREIDPGEIIKEENVLYGQIEEKWLYDYPIYKAAFLGDKILIDAHSGQPLKNYQLLLGEELKIHGYPGEINLTLDDFYLSELDRFLFGLKFQNDDKEELNFSSAFFVTRIDGWQYLCGESYYFNRYNQEDNFCFWHPLGPGIELKFP